MTKTWTFVVYVISVAIGAIIASSTFTSIEAAAIAAVVQIVGASVVTIFYWMNGNLK